MRISNSSVTVAPKSATLPSLTYYFTGMRVGELVKLNREDINFNERECIVFGKGTRNVSFTLMPGQRYICNNTWLLAKTEIRHSCFIG